MQGKKKQKKTKGRMQKLEAQFADYLPTASGLKTGSKGDQVKRLQRYLTNFGYLDSTVLDTYGVPRDRAAAPAAKDGTFDQNTVQALKRYQEFHGLSVTGELDEASRELMSKPRCGFPDVAEYVLQGNKWNKTALNYGFNEFTGDLSTAQVRNAVTQAFGFWSAVTPLTFSEVPLASSPDIVIRFVTGNHGDGISNAFDGPGGVLAHAYYPPPNGGAIAGDTHVDDAETWSVNIPPSGTDLVSVLAHEFGHALGLAHSTVSNSLMYPYYSGPHRYLHSDDTAGIQALYGASVGTWHGWEDLGGVIIGAPAVSSWAANRLDCFVRGTNNRMYHKWWNGSKWSGWENLGGVIVGSPAAVSWGPNRIDCFAPGTNNHMYHKWWDGSKWRGWEDLGGVIIGAPAVSSWAANRLDCFVRGTNNRMYHKWWNGSKWSGWENLGGVIVESPAAVSWGPNRIDCFAPGTNNHMYHKWWDGSKWRGWEDLGGVIIGAPAVSSWAANRLDCFVRGTNNRMYHKWWNGSKWSGWENLGGVIVESPAAVSWGPNRIDCFAPGTNNHMYHKWYA